MMGRIKLERSLYIDLELTCWEDGRAPMGQRPEIIQIGVAEVKLDTLEISREAEYYVRPAISTISEYCTALTGITAKACLKQGRILAEVIRSLGKKFGPHNKPCFSWGDDEGALVAGAFAAGISDLAFRITDLSLFFQMDFGLKKAPSLEQALAAVNESFEGTPHRALDDARNTARLHIAMLRRHRNL